jgi:hypothetical protein
MKKTWQEKLEDKASLPKVLKLEKGFPMTAANAVEEAGKEGKSLDIPYWRTLKAGGFLNEKYPGGQEVHKRLLERENFSVVARGKKYQVVDYEKYLMKLT